MGTGQDVEIRGLLYEVLHRVMGILKTAQVNLCPSVFAYRESSSVLVAQVYRALCSIGHKLVPAFVLVEWVACKIEHFVFVSKSLSL